MKKFLVGFILFSMVFSVIPGAVAIDYDLIAGQNEKVGTLTLDVIGDTLYFNYNIISPWNLCEVHLTALNEIPETDKTNIWYTKGYITKTGNPKVGQFEINTELDPCLTGYSGSLNISELDTSKNITVAAHAVVCKEGDEIISYGCEAVNDSWAVNYSTYINGSPDSTESWRYNPLLCLGESDSSNQGTKTFTSLGHGGSIELYFNSSICGDGDNSTPDLEIYEVTYNHNKYWVESISVEAFYNGTYYPVGTAINNEGGATVANTFINYIYDLPSGVCIEKIRINDTLSTHDYDIDAVKANYRCVPIYNCICETAWANDTCFGGNTFQGSNWATYVIYPECD
ncbi:hypothetical protein [Methanococcus sp. CF]